MEVDITVKMKDYEIPLERALENLLAQNEHLAARVLDTEESIVLLGDGLESAKAQIKHLEECEVKKTTSLFQTILESLKVKPRSHIKETTVEVK